MVLQVQAGRQDVGGLRLRGRELNGLGSPPDVAGGEPAAEAHHQSKPDGGDEGNP